jgi:hypothetical protein
MVDSTASTSRRSHPPFAAGGCAATISVLTQKFTGLSNISLINLLLCSATKNSRRSFQNQRTPRQLSLLGRCRCISTNHPLHLQLCIYRRAIDFDNMLMAPCG